MGPDLLGPHPTVADLDTGKFRSEFIERLAQECRVAWDDIHRNLRRLDMVKKRQEEAFHRLKERGIDLR
jgi:hypothetical protein